MPSGKPTTTNLLKAGTEALGEGPTASRRFPQVRHDQRCTHRGQIDAGTTGAGVPPH